MIAQQEKRIYTALLYIRISCCAFNISTLAHSYCSAYSGLFLPFKSTTTKNLTSICGALFYVRHKFLVFELSKL